MQLELDVAGIYYFVWSMAMFLILGMIGHSMEQLRDSMSGFLLLICTDQRVAKPENLV